MRLTRRATLMSLGGMATLVALPTGVVALVDAHVLPGTSKLNNALGRCDVAAPSAALRDTAQPPILGSFSSMARRRQVGFALSYPPGYAEGAHLPVCLLLHGHGGSARGAIDSGDYARFAAGAVRDGAAPFVLAAVDGDDTYWHPHSSDDPLSMLIDEFVPMLAARGLRTDRLAVAGWSMGGYGALLCALTYRDRFRQVVANSPAIFHSYADAHHVNPKAFDSPQEWARYDLTARAHEFAGLPVRITIGASDPFAPAVRGLRDRLPDPAMVQITTGCHNGRFWASVTPGQIRSISTALST